MCITVLWSDSTFHICIPILLLLSFNLLLMLKLLQPLKPSWPISVSLWSKTDYVVKQKNKLNKQESLCEQKSNVLLNFCPEPSVSVVQIHLHFPVVLALVTITFFLILKFSLVPSAHHLEFLSWIYMHWSLLLTLVHASTLCLVLILMFRKLYKSFGLMLLLDLYTAVSKSS